MDNNTLAHHGILGQKWGVRRYQNKDGTRTSAGKNREADKASKDERKQASQNRRTLSDAELKKRIERLQTEKRLKDLTEADLNPGRAAVKEVLANSGKKVATTVVTGAMLYAMKAAMNGKFDLSEAASYMTPKPKNK